MHGPPLTADLREGAPDGPAPTDPQALRSICLDAVRSAGPALVLATGTGR